MQLRFWQTLSQEPIAGHNVQLKHIRRSPHVKDGRSALRYMNSKETKRNIFRNRNEIGSLMNLPFRCYVPKCLVSYFCCEIRFDFQTSFRTTFVYCYIETNSHALFAFVPFPSLFWPCLFFTSQRIRSPFRYFLHVSLTRPPLFLCRPVLCPHSIHLLSFC